MKLSKNCPTKAYVRHVSSVSKVRSALLVPPRLLQATLILGFLGANVARSCPTQFGASNAKSLATAQTIARAIQGVESVVRRATSTMIALMMRAVSIAQDHTRL